MELYYQPHASRKREAQFVEHLVRTLPIKVVKESYFPLPDTLTGFTVDIRAIETLVAASLLTPLKKQRLLAVLAVLPNKVKVVNSMAQMTCDVVIVADGAPYYLEFHEEQHRNLTVARPNHVYTTAEEKIIVPRFAQRFLRDVWRGYYLRPFTVVWSDWFDSNMGSYMPNLSEGYKEYALPGKFMMQDVLCRESDFQRR